MKHYHHIVIGAGASGLFCAINLKNSTLLLDSNQQIGGKIKVSGGGACNITNYKEIDQFIKNIPHNSKFLYPTLNSYPPKYIYNYLIAHNIKVIAKNDDRIFPASKNSQTIIDFFYQQLLDHNVKIVNNYTVEKITYHNHYCVNQQFTCDHLIIATGGMTYQHLGTTGFGYNIAKQFNHTIKPLYPTQTAVVSHDEIINSNKLQGISIVNAKVELIINHKVKNVEYNDLIITHFGLSGPAIFRLSYYIHQQLLKKHNPKLKITPNQSIKRLNKYLDEDNTLTINITSLKGFKTAFVTGGGVNTREINPYTFESKLQSQLYFLGEVLDIHAHTGGYNLTICMLEGIMCARAINQID